jgi:hypothetical protein
MSFSINEFKSTLNKYGGPSRKNLYVVEITTGPANVNGIQPKDLRFFCQSVDVPGLNYTVADYYPNGFGLRETIPTNMQKDQFNAIFMLDSDHKVIQFFHQWMQSIINYNYADGAFSQVGEKLPYEIAYRKDISCNITVKHFTTDDPTRFYEYTLYDAFPTQVSGVNLSWSDNDSFATATVNFTYSHMSTSGMLAGTPSGRFSRGTGILDFINRLGTNGQVINQGRLPTSIQDAINLFSTYNTGIMNFNTAFTQVQTGLRNLGNVFR